MVAILYLWKLFIDVNANVWTGQNALKCFKVFCMAKRHSSNREFKLEIKRFLGFLFILFTQQWYKHTYIYIYLWELFKNMDVDSLSLCKHTCEITDIIIICWYNETTLNITNIYISTAVIKNYFSNVIKQKLQLKSNKI